MHVLRLSLAVGLAAASSTAVAGPIVIPSDLSVSLTAEPSADLRAGDVVSFTISTTNNGPEPVDRFALESSSIVDELDVLGATVDCDDHLFLTVVDLENGFYYTYIWQLVLPGEPPLQVGETRNCHFAIPYTASAPAEFSVTFSPGSAFTDLDPSNNSATVILRRQESVARAVPASSIASLALLAVLLMSTALAGLGYRKRTSQALDNGKRAGR